MNKDNNKKLKIGLIVAGIIILTLIIPMDYWSMKITKGRYISEANIVDKDLGKGTITVRLLKASENENMEESNCFLLLKGDLPDDCYISQRVMIGYSKEGLLKDTHQKVEVSFYKHGNVMTGFILKNLMPIQVKASDYQIVDCKLDGSLLSYNVAN